MNRIEIVGLFTALKKLCDKRDLESITEVVDSVLDEAQFAKRERSKDSD